MKGRSIDEYWDRKWEELAKEDPKLANRIANFNFQKWDAASVSEQSNIIVDIKKKSFANDHGYAGSTLLAKLTAAQRRTRKRLLRR